MDHTTTTWDGNKFAVPGLNVVVQPAGGGPGTRTVDASLAPADSGMSLSAYLVANRMILEGAQTENLKCPSQGVKLFLYEMRALSVHDLVAAAATLRTKVTFHVYSNGDVSMHWRGAFKDAPATTTTM
jgi:hypothetical protein